MLTRTKHENYMLVGFFAVFSFAGDFCTDGPKAPYENNSYLGITDSLAKLLL